MMIVDILWLYPLRMLDLLPEKGLWLVLFLYAGIVPLLAVAWRFTLKVSMTEEQLKEIQEKIRNRVQASPKTH